jgi:hypothetical protein
MDFALYKIFSILKQSERISYYSHVELNPFTEEMSIFESLSKLFIIHFRVKVKDKLFTVYTGRHNIFPAIFSRTILKFIEDIL